MIYTITSKSLDWFSAFLNLVLVPFIILLVFFTGIGFLNSNQQIISMSFAIVLLFLLILPYYRNNFKKLTKFATDTYYVHFKPSNKDLILSFYGQAFMLIILTVVILFFLPGLLATSNTYSLLGLSFGLALILQLVTFFLMNRSKIKLIETAIEPVPNTLLSELFEKTKDVTKIKNFAFADIKPASLFLSAGVTNYSFNSNICLISRYFQMKLSKEELMTVIGHEIGHVVHRDMFQNQFLVDLQAISRVFLIYFLFINLQEFFGLTNDGLLFTLLKFFTLILIVIVQLLISFSLRLRMFNQEILADEYGASIFGNYSMAYTLKKLPNVIPAPVDDSPFQFLGFRTAILFARAKQLNETDETVREFSRFSNN